MSSAAHVNIGSTLLRVLARDFRVTGFYNHAIGGIYFKSLYNPHPDPLTHLLNFCIKINSTGVSNLQAALVKHDLNKVVSTNTLLQISTLTIRDYTKGRLHTPSETTQSDEHGKETHEDVQSTPDVQKPRTQRRSEMSRKFDNLTKSFEGLLSRIDTLQSSINNTTSWKPEGLQRPIQCGSDVQPNKQTTSIGAKNSSPCRKVVLQSPPSSGDSNAEEHQSNKHEPINKIESRATLTPKRIASSSGSGKPNTKVRRKSILPSVGVKVTPSDYAKMFASDFGGRLFEFPHGRDDPEEYDSDYFERNERILNPQRDKINKPNCAKEQKKIEKQLASTAKVGRVSSKKGV
jgi:hypothetical protein